MQRKYFFWFILLVAFSLQSIAQLKTPAEFLGYELGTRFTRHHQMEAYFNHVADVSPNIKLQYYGETYEHRPLFVAFVASDKNFARLEEIRQSNLTRTGLEKNSLLPDQPALVWLSYNVHGNEAVSMEAAMQTIYDLANKNNSQTQPWLNDSVVIMDPCINPDGRDRYANWYNQYVNFPNNPDPNSKEHREPWISGRPNHYMFDLNRDWAWLTQKESQARIKLYNQWMPQVHVDFHEQGVDSPYYFAPAAEPFHEVISDWQREFQVMIGKNHAKYFDENAWLYFTKERFDLLYPSYGDTYPVYSGAIGMTYEQGGSGRAGLAVYNQEGNILSLKDRIAHHHATGLSTIEVASKNADQLLSEFEKYYKKPVASPYQSYVIKADNNPDVLRRLTQLFDAHKIMYGKSTSNVSAKGFSYTSGQETARIAVSNQDLIVNLNQPKGNLVRVLFEPKTKVSDTLTYDITAWTIPFAYNLNAFAVEADLGHNGSFYITENQNSIAGKPYAYIGKWNDVADAKFLSALLNKDIKVRFAENDFGVDGKTFKRGSLIITRANNKNNADFDKIVQELASQHSRNLFGASTGFVNSGNDFGSGTVKYIQPPKVAVLSGDGSSTLSFGEVWHFFEQELGYPVAVIDSDYFNNIDLDKYNTLVIPNGYYGGVLNSGTLEKIRNWVRAGNKLIVMQNALRSVADKDGFGLEKLTEKESDTVNLITYENEERSQLSSFTAGSIFRLSTDFSNPLMFGLSHAYYSLKLSNSQYKLLKDGQNAGYIKTKNDLMNGFVGSELLKNVDKTLVFGVENLGRGAVVYMVDNPLFREFWHSGKLLFSNALFLVNQR
jgi:hypothetical protein